MATQINAMETSAFALYQEIQDNTIKHGRLWLVFWDSQGVLPTNIQRNIELYCAVDALGRNSKMMSRNAY